MTFYTFTKPYQLVVFGPEQKYAASQPVNFVEVHIYDDIDHYSILSALSISYQDKQAILGDIISFLHQHSHSPMVKNIKNDFK
ncbi:MAG: hypothetical protein ABGY08_11020 [Gammaproteobacteria bacterium]